MRWQLASTFAALAMCGCYEASTVPCPDGVLCPADQACTGNVIGAELPLCGNEHDVLECRDAEERELCEKATSEPSETIPGLCIAKVCSPCSTDDAECRFETWTAMTSPVEMPLRAIHVVSTKRAYAVGSGGVALTYDGLQWSPMISGIDVPTANHQAVWDIGADVMVVGTMEVRSNRTPTDVPGLSANAIWGDSSKLIAVGTDELSGSYDGGNWTWTTPGTFINYRSVWGWGNVAVAVGAELDNGVVKRLDGATWSSFQPAPPSSLVAFNGVWGTSVDDFFVVGNDSASNGVILHYTGGSWSNMTPPGIPQLNAIWGNPMEAYAVGFGGTVVRFDGSTWSRMEHDNSKSVELTGISGFDRDAMLVTGSGAIWRLSPSS